MISCTQCGRSNSLDSSFCKSCGTAILEDDVLRARALNEELIADGYRLLNEGRLDESQMIAESAIESDPSASTAHALLGDVHERAGQYDEALLAYERVIELNPDSALDRVRVTHLRKLLSQQAHAAPAVDRGRTIAIAVAATVLVASLGAMGALLVGSRPAEKTADAAEKDRSTIVASNDAPNAMGFGVEVEQPMSTEKAAQPPVNNATKPPVGTAQAPAGSRAVPSLPNTGGVLPNPIPNGALVDPNDGGNVPLNPMGNIKVRPEDPPPATRVDPENVDPKPDNTTTTTQSKPNPPEAVIDIKPTPGASPTRTQGGGEMNLPGPGQAETLVRVGRNQFMTGNYTAAADAYEKAIRAGAPAGSTQQRLAQSYEKLGKKSEAIAAYQRAAKAFEGSGNSSAAAACRQAVRVLQGK